jgi:hypothetical protein
MKKLAVFAMTCCLLVYAATARAGYFFVTANFALDTDHDGDAKLSTSTTYSTLTACEAALPATAVQGCVANCDPANPSSEYILEEFADNDNDGFKGLYRGVGPYGYQADCETGIADVIAAGVTNVLPYCAFMSKSRRCK